MNVSSIFNFLLIAGAVHGFLFNVVTFLSRRRIETPIILLNLFVFFLSVNNLQSWLIDQDFIFSSFFLRYFVVPWNFLIVPMFYAFLVYYLGIERKKWPFLVVSCVLFFLSILARSLILLLVQWEIWSFNSISTFNLIEDIAALIYSLFLFFKAIRIVYNYEELYKSILDFDDLRWIKRFLFFGGLVFVLWIIAVVLNSFSATLNAPYSYYPLRLGSSILIYWVGYQAFFRYIVLKDRISLRREINAISDKNDIGKKSNINQSSTNEKQEVLYHSFNSYVLEHKKYLDPYLSLEIVAEELKVGVSRLSFVINQYGKSNFPDYINGLRVLEAKELLKNPDFYSYTVVAIGLECGFNSKSTFYTAFKKFTSITPIQYRKLVSS